MLRKFPKRNLVMQLYSSGRCTALEILDCPNLKENTRTISSLETYGQGVPNLQQACMLTNKIPKYS